MSLTRSIGDKGLGPCKCLDCILDQCVYNDCNQCVKVIGCARIQRYMYDALPDYSMLQKITIPQGEWKDCSSSCWTSGYRYGGIWVCGS